jgi:hypothetical protein
MFDYYYYSSSASFIKANSLSESQHITELNDLSNRDSTDVDNFGPLGNVRYFQRVSFKNKTIFVV